MKITTIIFDLDGTILDSKKSVIQAVYYISQKYCPNSFKYEDIEKRFGEPLNEFISLICHSHTDKEKIFNDYMKYISNYHDSLVKLFPNVKEGLSILKEKGYKLAIATNKQRSLTYRALELFNIKDLFDAVICLDDVKKGKPDPEMLVLTCEKLGVTTKEAIMIGDSIFDIKAAEAVNVNSILLDWYGHFSDPTKLGLRPNHVFTNIDEVLDKLLDQDYKEGLKIG